MASVPMRLLVLGAACIAALLLLSACMTPRQAEALAAALSPTAWVQDVIAIGSGLLGGTGAYFATNIHRDRLRKVRGEPVKPVA